MLALYEHHLMAQVSAARGCLHVGSSSSTPPISRRSNARAAREDVRVSRMVDHADRGPGGQVQRATYLGIHRMTCRFWNELCGRQVRLPPISESQWRARLKKIGYQLGTAPGYVVHIFPPEYLE